MEAERTVAVVRLDTHVAVWLAQGDLEKLSASAIGHIESSELVVSPMVELELTYLYEIGRVSKPGAEVVSWLRHSMGISLSTVPLAEIVSQAHLVNWTRDPFDRIIASDALVASEPLLTKDQQILEHLDLAVW